MSDDVLNVAIRPECFAPAERWVQPTGLEVRKVIKLVGSGSQASLFLGLGAAGPRTIRKWAADSTRDRIPYSAWALLCVRAGVAQIDESGVLRQSEKV